LPTLSLIGDNKHKTQRNSVKSLWVLAIFRKISQSFILSYLSYNIIIIILRQDFNSKYYKICNNRLLSIKFDFKYYAFLFQLFLFCERIGNSDGF